MLQRALLIALALAAATPTSSGDEPSKVDVRVAAPLRDDSFAALLRLNERADRPFAAVPAPGDGALISVWGGSWAGGDDAVDTAIRFLAGHGDLFGLDASWTAEATPRRQRVDVAFRLDGVRVEGVGVRVMLDGDGAVRGASATRPGATTALGSFAVDAGTAESHARAEITRIRDERGLTVSRAFDLVHTERVYLATADGLVPSLRLQLRSSPIGESYVVTVDARDGSVERFVDAIRHGTGTYPFFGGTVEFETGKAEGKVFTSIKNAIKGKTSVKWLKGWAKKGVGSPADIEKGLLVGAHADIWDANDQNAFSPKGKFKFGPNGSDADLFDQTNVYYQVEGFNKFLTKIVGPLQIDFSLPIIVNTTPPSLDVANAFFDPSPFPAGGHVTGYLNFDDLGAFFGGAPQTDFARDPTVVDHEYTHALLFFEGTPFQDTVDYPTRAVGEAIPDFLAASHHKKKAIGQYLVSLFGDALGRDLQDDDHFPETTLDAMSITGDLPQEHRNGEIFGSMLVDLGGAIGREESIVLLFDSLGLMPADMAALGYGSVTAGNAVVATADYFGNCAFALVQGDAAGDFLGETIGCATARGIFGQASSTVAPILNLEAFEDGKEKYVSRFVAGATTHEYYFRAAQGRTLKVKVIGSKSGKVKPDFTITDDMDNTATTHNGTKKTSEKGRIVEEGDIVLELALTASPAPTDPYYVLTVTTPADKEGKYKVVLDVD